MITNSHCSQSSWDLDGTSYFQDRPGANRYIGYEVRDPNGQSCGFLSPNKCRNADASAVFLEHDVHAARGFIARTYHGVAGPTMEGSKLIDPANPTFRITGTQTGVNGNQQVHMISWRTGWTYGAVDPDRWCEDVSVKYRGWSKLRCQSFARYTSRPGASGSPVFRLLGGSDVILVGINWGGTQDRQWSLFSPFGGVQADLGALSVIDPAYAPPPPPPPPPCVPDPPALECPLSASSTR